MVEGPQEFDLSIWGVCRSGRQRESDSGRVQHFRRYKVKTMEEWWRVGRNVEGGRDHTNNVNSCFSLFVINMI